jgi:predicted Zn-ribbon and HTH transcriptional regulator
MAKVTLHGWKCERCGHQWLPRTMERPTICPKCKTAYWDKPRAQPKRKPG